MEEYTDIMVIIGFVLGVIIMWFLHTKGLNQLKLSNEDLMEKIKLYEIQVAELKRLKQDVSVGKAEAETELRVLKEKLKEQELFKEKLFELQTVLVNEKKSKH